MLLAGCQRDTGPAGAQGATVLVSTTAEAAGTNCPNAGTKIQVGADANGNGVLDASEINAQGTRYVCNGTGLNSLVKTTAEPVGGNCAFGGTKIQTGLDKNNNGTLDTDEVSATSYSCNGQAGPATSSTGLKLAVKSVTTTDPIKINFTLKDDRGFPVDRTGVYSVNAPMNVVFSIMYVTQDAAGNVLPYTVLTKANSTGNKNLYQPTTYNPFAAASSTVKALNVGTLVENGPGTGDYTYTFPAADVQQLDTTGNPNGVVYPAITYAGNSANLSNTWTIWIQTARQTNLANTSDPAGYTAVNFDYNYIPANPNGTPLVREIASTAGCNACHRGFTAEGSTANGFHGSGRIDAQYCDVCHNPARTSNQVGS